MESPLPESPQEQLMPEKRSGSIGPIAGIVIIILLLALGGYYFFTQMRQGMDTAAPQGVSTEDPETEALRQTNPSDETAAIESDLEATSMGDIEADLQAIEGEF